MKGTFSTRLITWVGIPAALVLGFVVWNASRRSFDRVSAQTEQLSRLTARSYAAELETALSRVQKIPEMIGRTLETGELDTPEKIEAYLRHVVEKNPDIYGSCIAFKPNGLGSDINAYAPYFYRGPEGPIFEQLAKPDYNYFQWDWYRIPRDEGHAMWTEPYFDDGGGNTIMITFSAPFRREELFWGIATIDIAMSDFMRAGQSATVGKTGYVFVVSKQGRFLTYPDASKVMQATIQETDPVLGKHMLSGDSGFLRTRDPSSGRPAWIAFSPVHNGELSLAVVYPEDEALADARRLRNELLISGAIGMLALLGALIFVARTSSKPIAELARAAQLVADGDLEQRLSVTAPTEEVRNLMNAFNKMTRDLQMRMQELRYTTTVKERFEGELNAARSIQMSLVPKHFPAFPGRPEFEVHALLRPAREIGGDLYDFYFLDDEWLCFLIGDVSGKGVPAALFMAVTKTLLKASSSRNTPIHEMIAHVNDELCEQTDSGMFVSLLYAHLNTRTGEVEFCNAGHPFPYLLAADHTTRPIAGAKDVAIGAMSALDYHTTTLQLTPGDTLFFYTDGVTEAMDRSDRFYSNARLECVLNDVGTLEVEKITRGVVRDVRTFCGERDQSDDISVMALRWLGPPR
ncbi:MAG TPA: SpoIIE family protein phosphatase [Chthoniobacter sp.]|nr:SpoIIE family protein phosphatase [Chthoniobacter sp.]